MKSEKLEVLTERSVSICDSVIKAATEIKEMDRWGSFRDKAIDLRRKKHNTVTELNIELISYHRNRMTNQHDIIRADWTIANLQAQL